MSRIDDLIAKYCPNGVEYKTIADICNAVFAGGTPNTSRNDFYGGNIPWLRSGEVNFNQIYKTEKTITQIGYDGSSAKWIKPQSVLLAITGATVARSAVNEVRLTANQSVCAMEVKPELIYYKFLYYVIANKYEEIKGMAQGALTSINLSIVKKIVVPVPPLAVQEEIVKILDSFTMLEAKLEAKLEAELEARKKQYEHYREGLLSPVNMHGETKEAVLGDVCDFANGKGHEQFIVDSGKYVVVNSKFVSTNGEVRKFSDKQISPVFVDDILMVMSDLPNGKALAKCFLVDKNDTYTLNQRICRLSVKSKELTLPKYLYYVLNRTRLLLRYDNGCDQTNLRKEDILSIKIVFPSLAEQERIVGILDRFDALVNDISDGLPAEINARRQQYEYYRNRLLNFEPMGVVA